MKAKLKMIWRILWAKHWFVATQETTGGEVLFEYDFKPKYFPKQAPSHVYAEIAVQEQHYVSAILRMLAKKIDNIGIPEDLQI